MAITKLTRHRQRIDLNYYDLLESKPENQGKNILFSPYSISTALAMTYEGARGQTADEIRQVFGFPNLSPRFTTRNSGY